MIVGAAGELFGAALVATSDALNTAMNKQMARKLTFISWLRFDPADGNPGTPSQTSARNASCFL